MNEIYTPPKAISLTPAAAEKLQDIMSRPNADGLRPVGVRLSLKNAGCAGMEYVMEYATEIVAGDEVVEEQGITLLIDAKAFLFLLGTKMDYEIGKLSSGFVFHNPNQTDACGCGESVTLRPAQNSNQTDA